MTTSGSYNYSQNETQLIQDAFELIGRYGNGRTISSQDMATASRILNKMLKSWAKEWNHVWLREKGILFPTRYAAKHVLGDGSSNARFSHEDDTVITQLNGSHIAADTTLVVDSTTGMTASDIIGIVLTSGEMHWTTIVSVDSSTGITITSGLASAAGDNALVYTFTSRVYAPLRINNMSRVTGYDAGATSTRQSIELMPMSIEDYELLVDKTRNSDPTHYCYVPRGTTGDLYLYPRPNNNSMYYEISYERRIQDMDTASDDFDLPQEWLEAVTYQLAARLCGPFKCAESNQDVIALAQVFYESIKANDSENTSVVII